MWVPCYIFSASVVLTALLRTTCKHKALLFKPADPPGENLAYITRAGAQALMSLPAICKPFFPVVHDSTELRLHQHLCHDSIGCGCWHQPSKI